MGIEIRPAAVAAQIEAKAAVLSALLDEVAAKRAAARGFADDRVLSGAGYDAARQRVGSYDALLGAIETSVQRTMQVDARVAAALSERFGGMARASEDEWAQKQCEAEERARWLEGSLCWLRGLPTRSWQLERVYADAAEAAREHASAAGEMLSKIYSYCAETNGAYEGPLAELNASIARGCAAFASSGYGSVPGRWGALDASWLADLGRSAAEVGEQTRLEASANDPSAVFLSEDGKAVYVAGRKIAVEGAEPGLLSEELAGALAEAGLGAAFDLAALKAALDGEADAAAVLRAVGIEKPGRYRFTADGKVVFEGFSMAEGAKRMTTRVNVENVSEHARPAAVFESERVDAAGKSKAAGAKAGGTLLGGFFAAVGAAGAYGKAYDAGEGKDEDRRRSDAEAAVVGSLVSSGAGAVGAAAVGAIGGFVAGWFSAGPVPAVVGIAAGAAGGVGASYAAEYALKTDFDGDGEPTQSDIDEWWYSDGGHDAVDRAFNDYPEAYWDQLANAPTGMAR